MKSLTLALLLIPGAAFAGPWYELVNGTMSLTGVLGVAASSTTPKNYVLQLNGTGGYIQFPDGTRQTTAGVASSTISVNTSQFSGNGGSGNPLNLVTSSVTLQGNAISIAGLKGRIDSLDTATATLTTGKLDTGAQAASVANGVYTNVNNVISGHNSAYSWESNISPGYAYNWVLASTDSLKMTFYDVTPDIGQYFKYDKYGLVTSSGVRAGASRVDGSGGVNIIGSDGKIPALTSAYFANMDGSAITGLSTLDATKVPLGGGTMTGSLIFSPTDISTGQIVFQGGFPHSIQFNNQSATSGAEFLGEVQFLQSGTGKRRIIGFGDTSATYPKELQIGADTTSLGANVRITGSNTLSPDLFVSSWTSVGIGKANPYFDYKLDVAGKVNSTGGFFKNGVEIAAGGLTNPATFYIVKTSDYLISPASFTISSPDSLGSHIATMTITGNYGASISTLVVTGSSFSVGGSTFACVAGKCGVGTASPGSTLHVNGDVTAGSVMVSSFTATGSASFTSTTSTVTFGGGVQIGTFSVTGSGTSNGWTTLPNGLIMEWIYDNTGTSGTNTRTLPKAFPTSGLSCVCTYAGSPLANAIMGCAFSGTTQYVYYNYQGPALYCIFIGY